MEHFIDDSDDSNNDNHDPEAPYGCLPVIAAAIILWTIVGATWWLLL